ncbi:MAG: phosphatase PAP2 family protein [Clostridia bacterium]|nr:phosphatase PAP2 family protein [Clostridia bacterium]
MSFFTSDWLLTFDMNVYKMVEHLWLQNPAAARIMDTFWTIITHLGDDGIFLIIVGLILCIFKKTRKLGFAALIALAFASLMNSVILKDLFDRARPYIMDQSNWARVATDGWMYTMPFENLKETSVSFPSGHTASSFAFAMGALYIDKKKGIIPLILAFLIGFSRIYIHVHYPSDVIGGMITGIVFGLLACVIAFKVFGKLLDTINEKLNYKLFPLDEKKEDKPVEDVTELKEEF